MFKTYIIWRNKYDYKLAWDHLSHFYTTKHLHYEGFWSDCKTPTEWISNLIILIYLHLLKSQFLSLSVCDEAD